MSTCQFDVPGRGLGVPSGLIEQSRPPIAIIMRMAIPYILGSLLVLCATLFASPLATAAGPPRLLVLTDIGGDPDDQQSMRRLMLYSNEFSIQGLIASASGTPGEVGNAVVRPELIAEIVDDYQTVRDNLTQRAAGYPTAESLRAVIKRGNPNRGVANVGKGQSTDGSNHLISRVDASDETLHVSIWGGATDLAQALFDVKAARTPAETAAFIARLRVYAIADQDKVGTQQGTGEWIRQNFPTLRYLEAGPPSIQGQTALFRGMYQNDSTGGSGAKTQLVKDAVVPLNQAAWITANIRTGHGRLGAGYPLVKQNPGTARNTTGVKEGDTPSWFYLLPHGLGDPDQPTWGGWGGRFTPDAGGHFIDAQDNHWSGSNDAATRRKWTVARWREAYQNDFAARMDWAGGIKGANRNPVAVLNDDTTRNILTLTAKVGETVHLSAKGSTDPEDDALTYQWWVYTEAGTYRQAIRITDADQMVASLGIPPDATATQIHVILEVTDQHATVPLTAYRRLVINVK